MSPQNIEYEGRHRPTTARVDSWMAMQAANTGFRRDHKAYWFGYDYTPRHSVAHREQVA